MTANVRTTDKQQFRTICDYAYYHAKLQPDAEAMVLGNERTTYARLALKVDECAQALVALGIEKGDRVATLCTPSPDFFILFLATASIGAIWVGLNPKYTLDELSYVVCDSKPTVLFSRTKIAHQSYNNILISLRQQCDTIRHVISLDEIECDGCDLTYEQFIELRHRIDLTNLREQQALVLPRDSALIVYTSGTTGKPKGALLPNHGLIKCFEIQHRIYACSSTRVVNFWPINHIGCVGDTSCYTLIAGGAIIFMEQFDAEKTLEIMSTEKATIWGGVPTTLQMCLAHPNFEKYDLSSLELIIWSGAAVSKELAVKLTRFHPRLANCYGQTETVGSITFVAPCNDIDLLTNTIGIPPEEYDVRILNKKGEVAKDGETGEIVVKSDFIMNGYWGKQKETADTITPQGWLHTGDLGQRRPDGYFSIVGRMKEVFKSGGYNVYPREVEQVLEGYQGVDMVAVIAVPDPLYNEVGHAFILGSVQTIDEQALKDYCRKHLANYKIPKKFSIHAELPMLPIGKIDKMALKKISLKSA